MGVYGDQIGSHFRVQKPRTLISRGLSHATIAVTELRCDAPDHGMTTPIAPEDAFVVGLQLRDYSGDLWLDGKSAKVKPIHRGQIAVYDLKVDTQAYLRTPFHCLQFYLPGHGLTSLAEQNGASFNRDLNCALGVTLEDPIWMQIAQLMMPALEAPEQANPLFLDHLSLALAAHFAGKYGGMHTSDRLVRGGLAPWQLRLTKEMIADRLDGNVSLSEMAQACGLTPTYFARAFKQSTGLPPHRWLLTQRLEKARSLMVSSAMTLLEIAFACGFADQSHFARVFTRYYGVTPSVWRRSHHGRELKIMH